MNLNLSFRLREHLIVIKGGWKLAEIYHCEGIAMFKDNVFGHGRIFNGESDP